MDLGDEAWVSKAKSCAPDAARAKGEERLHNLIGHAIRVRPWVQPDGHAHAHMAEEHIADDGCDAEERQRQEYIALIARSHIGHEHRDAEEQQGGTQVLFHDEHQHGETPDADERRDEAQRRQPQYQQPTLRGRQHLLMIREVGREKEQNDNLAELRRLHRHRSQHQPVLAATDLRTEKHRQAEYDDAGHSQQIGVIQKLLQGTPETQHENHDHKSDAKPTQLRHEERRFQPTDFHRAYAGERQRNGQQQRVSLTPHQQILQKDGQERHGCQPGQE